MSNAKTTRGRTMTNVVTPKRQLNERDLAIAPVLSAKSFGRVNESFTRRFSHRLIRRATVGAPRRAPCPRVVMTVDDTIPTCGGRALMPRRSDAQPLELAEQRA